jgi:signal transduction histidine kinase
MSPNRAVLWTTAVLALSVGAAVAAAIVTGFDDNPVALAVLELVIGWSFVGSGLVAWSRRSDNRTGPLMIATGFAWFLAGLQFSDNSLLATVGALLENLFIIPFAYLLLAFPSGRLESRLARAVTLVAFLDLTVPQLAWMLFGDIDGPENLLQVTQDDGLALAFIDLQRIVGVVLAGITIGMLAQRWRAASPPLRRAIAPVLWSGTATLVAILISVANDTIDQPLGDVEPLWWLVFATVPYAFLTGLLRLRLARSAVADLVVELGATAAPGQLRDALARALGDPALSVSYWLPDQHRYVDVDGMPVELPADGEERTATVVEREGRRIAALVHDPALLEDAGLVESVCAAAALALENERLQADLKARLEELRASRARIVQATESERRRIERNLHDGTQQRLVSIAMMLGLAESRLANDSESAAPIIGEARQALSDALVELRELSQGIHPGILTERGLEPALGELAYRAGVAVNLDVSLEERLPEQVEATAYYVVSESLANVAKYARATAVSIQVGRSEGQAVVEVVDDGIGGADGARGSGLRGLRDRVEALGGRFSLASPPGRGTIVRVEIPCG